MVRTYQRKFTNSRNFKNYLPYLSYSNEELQKAVEAIENGLLKLTEAAEKYNIPKSTLSRKCRNINCSQEKAGHPTLFSKDEEMAFLEYIKLLGAWGFPLDSTDLRVFAQKYLNKIGKTLYSLKDNMPGIDWARNFINRHKSEISNRQASNVSRERAKISQAVIDDFFLHYKKSVEGVSPDCLINYDETNLTDDPGNKKYLFKRGCKYPERVINNTKTSISLMFTGTADGQLLPVYVVYKADHLWDQWLEGGPTGTRYNRSRSGWFDFTCFEDWFNTIIVPYAKTKLGRKVIIGDNLSSHFSQSVLRTCQELNIMFVCLPPKTTHLLQPLDVAFYAPLKKYWRDVLTQWKKTDGLKHKTLVKSSFPKLLCRLHNKLTEKGSASNNIIAGFNKCGLYPLNPERSKSRLPQINFVSEEQIQNTASAAIVEILQDLRNPTMTLEQPKRRTKCNVPPGKSITAKDVRVEQTQLIKSRQTKRKNIVKSQQNKRKNKSNLISYEKMRSSSTDSDITRDIEREKIYYPRHPIAGPSGLCTKKKQTIPNKEDINRGNETDTTYVSSQDEYLDNKSKLTTKKNKTRTQPPVSSFISIKGKGMGKKSKLTAHNTNNIDKVDSKRIKGLNASTTITKLIRKKAIRKSCDSSTSVSDVMSVHSDSDLLDVNFGEHSSDVLEDNSYLQSEMYTLPCVDEDKDNSDDKSNEKKELDNKSIPLFFFDDKSGGDEVVVGEDNNTVTVISFDEKVLFNKDYFKTNDKENNKVVGNNENEDMIENKENNIEIGKRVTIIKEESVENVLTKKKVVLKNLKPVSLDQPIITRKMKKNYYNNSQEILKVLIESDND